MHSVLAFAVVSIAFAMMGNPPPNGCAVERLAPGCSGRDMAGDVNAALDRLRHAGGGTLEFEKGEYHFKSASAHPLSFGISNHDQSARHQVLFPMLGMKNVSIKANGSRFLSDSPVIAFAVVNSTNVSFNGFSLDSERPAMTEAIVKGFDHSHTFVSIDMSRYPFSIEGGRIVMTASGWTSPVTHLIVFDGENGGIVPGSGDVGFNGTAEMLGDGTVSLGIDLRKSVTNVKPGDVVVLRPERRPSPVFFVSDSSNVALTDIVVHDGHGMALLAQHSEDVSWVGTGPAGKRLSGVFPSGGRASSTHADATHFSNVKGEVVVENCYFEGMMDDAINVHSTCLSIRSIGVDGEVVCQYMHYQAEGFDVFRPGERVRFLKSGTLEEYSELCIVEAAKLISSNLVLLKLGGLPPKGVVVGDAVENADFQPSVTFRNNIVRGNRARGALFTTPKPVVVEGNIFERVSGSAVLLAGDISRWYESGRCEDVIVRANVFSNCCASAWLHGYCGGVVSIWPTVPRNATAPYHRNISVNDNVFHSFDVPLLYGIAASNVVFSGNSVRRNSDYPGWGKGDFDFSRCWDVKVSLPAAE